MTKETKIKVILDDYDIAKRLCNPTELKRTDNGRLDPNKREQWLDTQARALYQACRRFMQAYRTALIELDYEED